jgi:hypothetical protein
MHEKDRFFAEGKRHLIEGQRKGSLVSLSSITSGSTTVFLVLILAS